MFKVGDQVICIHNVYRKDLIIGEAYIVQEVDCDYNCMLLKVLGNENYFAHTRFELVNEQILYPTLRCDYV